MSDSPQPVASVPHPSPAASTTGIVPGAFALRGALGFALVSVAAFAVWTFAGRWFHGRGGEGALYASIAGVFVVLTGLLLHPLVRGEHRVRRFYAAFGPAFAAYAAVWSVFWFWLKLGAGEWLGALLGSLTFVAIIAWSLGGWPAFVRAAGGFFVLHTAGYFAGGQSMALLIGLSRQKPVPFLDAPTLVILAKLSWGLLYGLGFGAGLGYVFALFQKDQPPIPETPDTSTPGPTLGNFRTD